MTVYLAFEYDDVMGVYSNRTAAQAHVDKARAEYDEMVGVSDRTEYIKVVELTPKDTFEGG